ncbi:MAG: glucose-1-phosphate adenylyltransferase, partial [Propionibacteriaceae bacterium]|nr:glucose-1-phosphate adenylyltransferase [Propionibacteriaceae bacterium]
CSEKDANYWRDVGTIDAYHEAHMDLVSVEPEFNLYNRQWPIWTNQVQAPGAKFVMRGTAEDSIVTNGCIISGGDVDRTVLSPNVRIEKWAKVDESILMDSVQVGRGAVVHRAILDKHVIVPDGVEIGVNHDHDRARGFTVSEGGVTVVGKDIVIPPHA